MKLKELRREKHMTQQEVADALGVSQVTYSRYESGEREPSNDMLIALSSYFDVSVDELLGVTTANADASEIDEFTAYRMKKLANPEYANLVRRAEKSPPEHIRAAIAVLDALEPFA